MNIAECKAKNRLPETGIKVRTIIDPEMAVNVFFVKPKHINARKNAPGSYLGWVPGAGGDVWWIEHEPGVIGAYASTEVFDEQPQK